MGFDDLETKEHTKQLGDAEPWKKGRRWIECLHDENNLPENCKSKKKE